MNKLRITKKEARRYLIHYHGLDSYCKFEGEQGILEFIKKVGCIQYDPLNVVGRNPDLVLQSRIDGYTPYVLEKLLYTNRSLVDGWDKMMAIYRKEDWPLLQSIREKHEKSMIGTMKNRGTLNALKITDEVKNIIKENGPIQASEINIGIVNTGSWGHRKLSSVALDYMFNRGELGISNKRNTQKKYDLIENLLPSELIHNIDSFPNEREFLKWYFKRRIGSLGLIWSRNGGGWLGHFLSDKSLRESILKELVNENSVVEVYIEGVDEKFYIISEDVKIFDSSQIGTETTMRFLAPLDNLLWDRGMIEEIFGFKYSWEVYIPKDKRKFGYYVLPVLYGNQFVARFEPEKHRGESPLEIKNWWWEEGITVTDEIKNAVDNSLKKFCNYLKADGLSKESMNRIYSQNK